MNALGRSHFTGASIGWSRGKGFVSKMIRRLEKSYFNHVYLKFDLNNGMKLIYESHLKGGVQITPYEHLLAAKVKGQVLDVEEVDLDLTPDQCQLLWNNCIPLHGDSYDGRQILIYYAWIRLLRKKKNAKLFKLNNRDRFTCNEFVVRAGQYVVPEITGLDYSYTPERLFALFHAGEGSVDWSDDRADFVA